MRLSLPVVWVITIRIATVVSVQNHKGVVVRNGRGPSLEKKLTVQSSDHGLFCSNLLVGGKYLICKGDEEQRGKGVTEITIDQGDQDDQSHRGGLG